MYSYKVKMPATPVSVTVRRRENKKDDLGSDDESYNFKNNYESDDNNIEYENGGPNRSARQNNHAKVSVKNKESLPYVNLNDFKELEEIISPHNNSQNEPQENFKTIYLDETEMPKQNKNQIAKAEGKK